MIFIVVKFTIRPEYSESWLDAVSEFTEGTRAEPGNLFFEWSKSVEVPNQYVLVEGFAGQEAGKEHVNSAHFKAAMSWMPDYIATTPEIINAEIPNEGWGQMGELSPSNP
ncbi:MAG: antibiotic biosynthesis monooxygenase [Actinophytocola sp.]|nr:antibiotic biosynthesis monooxygenase [Actinophytocola sp.]